MLQTLWDGRIDYAFVQLLLEIENADSSIAKASLEKDDDCVLETNSF